MNTSGEIKRLLVEIKHSRKIMKDAKDQLTVLEDKLHKDPLYLALKAEIEYSAQVEEVAREMLLKLQKNNEKMLHPAIKSIRTDTTYKFDVKQAVDWCKTNAPILLTVGKEFNEFLKKNSTPDFVTTEQKKSIVLASNLSKFEDLDGDYETE